MLVRLNYNPFLDEEGPLDLCTRVSKQPQTHQRNQQQRSSNIWSPASLCELEAGPADSTREGILSMAADWRRSPSTKIGAEEQMDTSNCWDQDGDNSLGRINRGTDRTFEVRIFFNN